MADAGDPYRILFHPFAALSGDAVYDLMKLRFDVFVLEQQSLYPELDGADKSAVHCRVLMGDEPVATSRILGLEDTGPLTIGRVAVHADHRATGLGRRMFSAALDHIETTAPGRPVKLGAQIQLEAFYASFGFQRSSDIYDDGGIDHVDMTLPKGNEGA